MPTSLRDFERRLLEAAIAEEPERDVLAAQVAAARVDGRECTGHGLYVRLLVDESAMPLSAEPRDRQLGGARRLHLCHPALRDGAGAIVWVAEGRIDMIECFVYDGSWPEDDAGFRIHERSASGGNESPA